MNRLECIFCPTVPSILPIAFEILFGCRSRQFEIGLKFWQDKAELAPAHQVSAFEWLRLNVNGSGIMPVMCLMQW